MRAKRQLRRHGVVEFFVGIAEDHGAETAHVVDIHIAVDVIKTRALRMVDEDRIFLIGRLMQCAGNAVRQITFVDLIKRLGFFGMVNLHMTFLLLIAAALSRIAAGTDL